MRARSKPKTKGAIDMTESLQKSDFAAYIQQKRKAAGLTQEELARQLYVTKSTVSKWERGVSYPDISLVRDVCQALSISEHEFFTACDDVAAKREKRDATAYRSLLRGWSRFFTWAYLLAAAICLICNLAVYHTLSWFWIVLTALLLAWCCTGLPLEQRIPHRPFVFAVSATGCLFLLLFACWGYVGGAWLGFGIAVTAVCAALPWGLFLLVKFCPKHRGFPALVMAAVTAWTAALVALCTAVTGVSVAQGLSLTAMAYVPAWLLFAVAAYLPAHPCLKAGLYCLVADFVLPFFNLTLNALFPEPGALTLWDYLHWPPLRDFFAPSFWQSAQNGPQINVAVFVLGLFASVVVLAAGIVLQVRQIRRKRKS